MRLAIFDCDGTLVDSQADICAAMDAAFAAAGLVPPERHATRRVVGLSLHEAMRQLHPAGAHEDHASLTGAVQGCLPRAQGGGRRGRAAL